MQLHRICLYGLVLTTCALSAAVRADALTDAQLLRESGCGGLSRLSIPCAMSNSWIAPHSIGPLDFPLTALPGKQAMQRSSSLVSG